MRRTGGMIAEQVGRSAVRIAEDAMKAGVFNDAIEKVVVDTVRDGADSGLSRIGFILKITVELIDRSAPSLPYRQARGMADEVWQQFRKDNEMVKFGTPGWDWTGVGARILAHEYEIYHWEVLP